MKIAVLIAISIGIISIIININFRFDILENSNNEILVILLGSYASFTSTVGMTLFFTSFLEKWKRKIMILIGLVLSGLIREVQSYGSVFGGEGNTFDYYDIAAVLIGGILSYFLLKNCSSFLNKKFSLKKH